MNFILEKSQYLLMERINMVIINSSSKQNFTTQVAVILLRDDVPSLYVSLHIRRLAFITTITALPLATSNTDHL